MSSTKYVLFNLFQVFVLFFYAFWSLFEMWDVNNFVQIIYFKLKDQKNKRETIN